MHVRNEIYSVLGCDLNSIVLDIGDITDEHDNSKEFYFISSNYGVRDYSYNRWKGPVNILVNFINRK